MGRTICITEQQCKLLKEQYQNEILTELLSEDFSKDLNFSRLLRKVKTALAAGAAVAAILAAINKLDIDMKEKEALIEATREAQKEEQNKEVKEKKVQAIKDCFKYYCDLKGYNADNIKLSPEKMIEICDHYGYDLPLMLAQAKLESFFGFGNRAQRTNSVWSIGSYDNGKNMATYSSPDASIEPYVKTMINDYLDGKTVDDVLKPGQLVNKQGMRYASDPNYEKTLAQIRNAIISRFPDLML